MIFLSCSSHVDLALAILQVQERSAGGGRGDHDERNGAEADESNAPRKRKGRLPGRSDQTNRSN
jgi:hypothetical protein